MTINLTFIGYRIRAEMNCLWLLRGNVSNAVFSDSLPRNLAVFNAITAVAATALIGYGIYHLYVGSPMWGNYALSTLAGCAIFGANIYNAVLSVREYLQRSRVSVEQSPIAQPPIERALKPLKARPPRKAELTIWDYEEFNTLGLPREMWHEILKKIVKFDSSIEAFKTLTAMIRTCRYFYKEMNGYQRARETLDFFYRFPSIDLRELSQREGYPPRDVLYRASLTAEMYDNPEKYFRTTTEIIGGSNFATQHNKILYPMSADNWIQYIEAKNTPLIEGVHRYGCLFFAALLDVSYLTCEKRSKNKKHVVVFYESVLWGDKSWFRSVLVPTGSSEQENGPDFSKFLQGTNEDMLFSILRGETFKFDNLDNFLPQEVNELAVTLRKKQSA
ncbi:MAG: hypothetical protein JJU12_07920 [Chlamydiales bacterium]|nr:hypothetical protein [Chlamydiales bacterium]